MATSDLRRDWAHLGRMLRASRGGRSRAVVERLSGVSATQIKRYEAGLVTPPTIPDKMWMLATFYGWTHDSLNTVLAGGSPTYAQDALPVNGAVERVDRAELSPGVCDKALAAVLQAEGLTAAEKREFVRWVLAQEP